METVAELGGKNRWVDEPDVEAVVEAVGGSNSLVEMDGDFGVDGKENSSVAVELTKGDVGLYEFCCVRENKTEGEFKQTFCRRERGGGG